MSEDRRPPGSMRQAGEDHSFDVEAIVFNEHEADMWRVLSSLLDEPIGVCFRLCALSGAEHYLAEIGKWEQAAMAGALLRLYAQSKGIEIQATNARPSDTRMGHKTKKGKQRG